MGIGIGIVLLVIGLILALGAIDLPASIDDAVATDTLGWIFIVVGVLAIVLALVMNAQRSRTTTVVDDRRPPPSELTPPPGTADVRRTSAVRASGRVSPPRHPAGAPGRPSPPVTTRIGTPQSCWCMWQAAPSPPSASHDAARAATCSTPSPTARVERRASRVRSVPRPSPSWSSAGGRGGHHAAGSAGPNRSSTFCPGGGLKSTSSSSAAADLGDRPLGRCRERPSACGGRGVEPGSAGARPTRRPARRVAVDDGVAGLGQPGRQRGEQPGRRVEAADRAVVGVGHGDRAVGQHGDARAGAAAAPRRPARRGSRSRRALPDARCGPPPSSHDPQRARSPRPRPTAGRRRRASPDGWANHASASGPSTQPLVGRAGRPPRRVAGRAGRTSTAGGCRPSRPRPGPATRPRPRGSTSRVGRRRPASTAGRRRPRCVTVAVGEPTPRSAWLTVSATTTSYPTCAGDVVGQQAQAVGLAEPRRRRRPSTSPRSPAPMRRTTSPRRPSSTRQWWPASATSRSPPGSAIALAGKRRSRVRRLRRDVRRVAGLQRARGRGARRPARRAARRSRGRAPRRRSCATTYPSGSTSTSVGQARAV